MRCSTIDLNLILNTPLHCRLNTRQYVANSSHLSHANSSHPWQSIPLGQVSRTGESQGVSIQSTKINFNQSQSPVSVIIFLEFHLLFTMNYSDGRRWQELYLVYDMSVAHGSNSTKNQEIGTWPLSKHFMCFFRHRSLLVIHLSKAMMFWSLYY